jgi:hypothetical protein
MLFKNGSNLGAAEMVFFVIMTIVLLVTPFLMG